MWRRQPANLEFQRRRTEDNREGRMKPGPITGSGSSGVLFLSH